VSGEEFATFLPLAAFLILLGIGAVFVGTKT
jgi:hypothetical protein